MGKKLLMLLSLVLVLSFQAEAADQGGMKLESVSEVEVTIDNGSGKEEIIRVNTSEANVVPGDTVILTNYYDNGGDKPADDVVLTNPIPEQMVYLAGSAEGEGSKIEFSVDQGKSWDRPENLKVKDEEGKERVAEAADYTNIRWTFVESIAKGGAGRVSFKAKVK